MIRAFDLAKQFHTWVVSQPPEVQATCQQDVLCVDVYFSTGACNVSTAFEAAQRLSTLAHEAGFSEVGYAYFDLMIDLQQAQEAER